MYLENYKDEKGYHGYSYVKWEGNVIVLDECLSVNRAIVQYIIHPHPSGSNVGVNDFNFANQMKLPVIAVGVPNNNITWYRYLDYMVPYNLTPSELYNMLNR